MSTSRPTSKPTSRPTSNTKETKFPGEDMYKLNEWATMECTTLPQNFVKNFSQLILRQYYFHVKMPNNMLPIHHLNQHYQIASQGGYISDRMVMLKDAIVGNRLTGSDTDFLDSIYMFSEFYNLRVYEVYLDQMNKRKFDDFKKDFQKFRQLLMRDSNRKIEIPPQCKNQLRDLEKLKRAVNTFKSRFDKVRNSWIISPDFSKHIALDKEFVLTTKVSPS